MKEDFRYEVQRLTASHLAGAALLEALCFSEPWSEKSLEMLLAEPGVGFAVIDRTSGQVQAYGGMLCVGTEGQVTNIAVDPDCRRRGHGRAVTAALLGEAAARGLEQVTLEVRASNEAAIALYQQLGFAAVGRRPHFYRRPTEDAVLMTLNLPTDQTPLELKPKGSI